MAAAISSAACALRRRAHDLFAACGVGVVGQNGQPEALPAMVHGQVYERSRLGGSADRLASHGYPCVPLRIGTRPADGSFTATFGALNPTRLSRGARGLPGTVAYSCAHRPLACPRGLRTPQLACMRHALRQALPQPFCSAHRQRATRTAGLCRALVRGIVAQWPIDLGAKRVQMRTLVAVCVHPSACGLPQL